MSENKYELVLVFGLKSLDLFCLVFLKISALNVNFTVK